MMPTLYEQDERKYVEAHPWQIQPWATLIRKLWHSRAYQRWVDQACSEINLVGTENLADLPSSCVFVANHSSHLDTLLIKTSLPGHIAERLYFGAAQDRWYIKGRKKLELKPWYQSLALGNFPIKRGGGRQALTYAHWLLTKQQHVFLFPEGTRATGETLGEFKPGAAMLALEHQVPVVPIYLAGLRAIRPKGSQEVTTGSATVEFLKPIATHNDMTISELTDQLQASLNAVHRQHNQQEVIEENTVDRLAA